MIDWSALDAALERRAPLLWWRDDDAIAPTPALDRLLALAESVGAPMTLATIPAHTTDALAARINATPTRAAVHGWAHTSHAPDGEKNAEFGPHRPLATRMTEAKRGLRIVTETFGATALPVFIPPWNRLAPDMPDALAGAGFRGLSVYGERSPRAALILPRFDAHLDPIDWRGTRSAVDPAGFVAQICTMLDDGAPIGLMTHHLVHDPAIWELVEAVVTRLTARGARWTSLAALIDADS